MYIEESQLDNFIRDSGLLSRAEFDEIENKAKEKNQSFSQTLVNEGKLTEDDLRKIQAHILGIPFVDLKSQKIDFEVLSLIPEPIARNHNIIAFKRDADALEIAMLDTDDLAAIEFVKKKVHLKIMPRLTDAESIKSALLQYQKSLKAEFGDLIQGDIGTISALAEGKADEATSAQDLKKLAEDVPVVRIVDTLLKHAILQGASDIHIEQMEKELLVRYRIDGLLHDAMILPKNVGASITARIKVLSNLKLDEKRLPQDGRFKIEVSGEKVSFRVSTLPTHFGEKTVMRLLRETSSGFSLEVLGFHGDALEHIHSGMKQKTGMLLTTGPTGSGKTTTLYTMVDILNTPEVNISTIEDPIEYQMARVNQTQVKPEIGLDFSMGLRTLMRQDPDIIMVGEIRDKETASLAINEPFLIVTTVNVIIGQRLVRKLVGKDKYYLSKAGIDALGKSVDLDRIMEALKKEKIVPKDANWEKIPFYRPKPSEESKDGYKGRVGIYEVLKVSGAIKEMIIHGATAKDVETQAKKEGMLTMIEDGIFKAVQGLTTIEEVLRVVSE